MSRCTNELTNADIRAAGLPVQDRRCLLDVNHDGNHLYLLPIIRTSPRDVREVVSPSSDRATA